MTYSGPRSINVNLNLQSDHYICLYRWCSPIPKWIWLAFALNSTSVNNTTKISGFCCVNGAKCYIFNDRILKRKGIKQLYVFSLLCLCLSLSCLMPALFFVSVHFNLFLHPLQTLAKSILSIQSIYSKNHWFDPVTSIHYSERDLKQQNTVA